MIRTCAILLLAACSAEDDSSQSSGRRTGDSDNTGGDTDSPSGVFLQETCPFTPCGGNLVGTWNASSVCLTIEETVGQAQAQCPTATIDAFSGTVTGDVVITATNLTQDVSYSFTGTVTVPPACTFNGNCAAVQGVIAGYFDTASCSPAGGNACTCTVGSTILDQITDTYTASGNSITLGGGAVHEYCVSASSLRQKQVSPGNQPGVFTYAQ